jgi:hypothetical protein
MLVSVEAGSIGAGEEDAHGTSNLRRDRADVNQPSSSVTDRVSNSRSFAYNADFHR